MARLEATIGKTQAQPSQTKAVPTATTLLQAVLNLVPPPTAFRLAPPVLELSTPPSNELVLIR